MYEVKSIIRPERIAAVVHALHDIPNIPGVTVSVVRGFGRRAATSSTTGVEYGETEMAKLETVVPEALLPAPAAETHDFEEDDIEEDPGLTG